MNPVSAKNSLIVQTATSIRIVLITIGVCSLFYPLIIWYLGQALTPDSANGSLVHNNQGEIIGSALIAQSFDRPEYFWPRPSAINFNAAAAGGSNLSPTNPELRARAITLAARFEASADHPIPADLVTASGSGLDPNITLAAAQYQVGRVAAARGLTAGALAELLQKYVFQPGGIFTAEPLVNVLLVNLELDRLDK